MESDMSYKTILVHVDQSKHAPSRIRIAADIAARENGHLIGAAMTGLSRYLYEENAIDMNRTVLANHVESLSRHAGDALVQFERIAAQAGVQSVEKRLVKDDNQGGLTLQARYSDLVVLGQTDPDEPSSRTISNLPEYVVLNSGRPVLIVPYAGTFNTVGEQVLVAWDGRMEAIRAVASAIPVLRHAKRVVIAVFNPSIGADEHGEQPGADIALYLARHGVNVEVMPQVTPIDVGNALLSLAADLNSDMIVMGGYGHTRFREVLLGGVTRTVLASMTVPVMMSH
jgi:nucleotide-binding universal stress UspA family protein